jgi:hypothetical protein
MEIIGTKLLRLKFKIFPTAQHVEVMREFRLVLRVVFVKLKYSDSEVLGYFIFHLLKFFQIYIGWRMSK